MNYERRRWAPVWVSALAREETRARSMEHMRMHI